MYTVAVTREFVAQHFLTSGGDGPESRWHSHHYRVEVQLEGRRLDEHGYLVNIDDVKAALGAQLDLYRDTTLNEAPAFEGLNPSIEHFARALCHALTAGIHASNLEAVAVTIWEDEHSWARFRHEI
jgi:6-pyruvoyltetrahydropterin/6-carboxytetrahydropterin synthase